MNYDEKKKMEYNPKFLIKIPFKKALKNIHYFKGSGQKSIH